MPRFQFDAFAAFRKSSSRIQDSESEAVEHVLIGAFQFVPVIASSLS